MDTDETPLAPTPSIVLRPRPTNYAANPVQISSCITKKSGIDPTVLSDSGGLTVASGSQYAVAQQNGLSVLLFTPDSTGISGTWGPIGASWTLTVFVRADRPVGSDATFLGPSNVPNLMSCPALGITVPYPTGGSVPSAALSINGGTLDGVAAGWTWDQVLVGQWRAITVCNQAGGRRITYIDGCEALNTNPSTASIPANTTFTLLANCPVRFAEFVIWSTGDLTVQDFMNHRQCMRTKWKVTDLPPRPVFTGTLSLPITTYRGGILPSGIPRRVCTHVKQCEAPRQPRYAGWTPPICLRCARTVRGLYLPREPTNGFKYGVIDQAMVGTSPFQQTAQEL